MGYLLLLSIVINSITHLVLCVTLLVNNWEVIIRGNVALTHNNVTKLRLISRPSNYRFY